ncbi:septal ring lytic transglycosylase RlpA family protein [Myxococcaceae bacterium GXIMD 01537]
MKRWMLAAMCGALGLATGCATRATRPPPAERPAERQPTRGVLGEGLASYYGPGLHGRPTASGEKMNQHALTAAHRTVAFGTCLRVVNMENGRSVQVRVNDRGPFKEGRIVDVSLAAAKKLDMVEKGLARVRLYRCDTPVSFIPEPLWAAPV